MASLLKPAFLGSKLAFQSSVSATKSRGLVASVDAKKVCDLTGAKRNKANKVCFSNKKARKWQEPNLQHKKLYWEQGQRWVTLHITTRAIKTIQKSGLDGLAKEAGIDLWKLPFEDARPQRLAYLEENKGKVPQAENPRAIKNPTKIAQSIKKPRVPVYTAGGKIVWVRPGQEAQYTGDATDAQPTQVAAEKPQLKINLLEESS